eukprot:4680547-Pyramimonas_sp.AAC.1
MPAGSSPSASAASSSISITIAIAIVINQYHHHHYEQHQGRHTYHHQHNYYPHHLSDYNHFFALPLAPSSVQFPAQASRQQSVALFGTLLAEEPPTVNPQRRRKRMHLKAAFFLTQGVDKRAQHRNENPACRRR